MIRRLLLIFLSFIVWISLSGQPVNPGPDDVYRPTELATIKLTLTAADKAFLLNPANLASEVYLKATFQMTNSRMDTILSKPVGIRLRGNTSRGQNKKPFKIDFREFNGKKFFGYKKFNLKPNVNDPSQVREPLSLQLYREMNIPAARTSPIKLYMNGEYMGVYLNVEQLDDVFLTSRYGHEEGFLYKCAYGANLVDNGQVYNTAVFESEINEDEDTRAELNNFVHLLNTVPDQNFSTEIEKVFNVDLYLKQLAVEAMLGHWDGYSYNKNNFYLYFNPHDGKISFLPYDTDNTWGIDWTGIVWSTRNLNNWAHETDARPLTKRILAVPAYKEKYKSYILLFMNDFYKMDFVSPIIEPYRTMLAPAVQIDTYFNDAFGFTYNNFLNSFYTGMTNNHVKTGVTEFLQKRRESASIQVFGIFTAVENESLISEEIYPNPSVQPQAYYYSSTGKNVRPVVYTSTGIPIAISYVTIDETTSKITLPAEATCGLYIIHANGKVFKWIYQQR